MKTFREILEAQAKTYLSRDVIKKMIKSGKWEVDFGDVDGKSGSSLTLRSHTGKKRNVIIEKKTDNAIRFIADQLTNDESSTDAEMVLHLAKETHTPVGKMAKLVKALRPKFISGGLIDRQDAAKMIKKYL